MLARRLIVRTARKGFSPIPVSLRYFSAPVDPTSIAPPAVDVTPSIPVSVDGITAGSDILTDSMATVMMKPLTWSPPDLIIQLIDNVHHFADIPYWQSIVALTIGLRILLIPVALKTITNSARMAALRPDMQKVQDAMVNDPNKGDPRSQQKYSSEMRNLFVKHKVNPFHAMMMPLFQMPIFISCFMSLRKMHEYFPEFCQGGDFWFVDLSAVDPYMIFPVCNALSFLLMVEMGADGIQAAQKETFKWVMRGLAVSMVPLTASMPTGLFVYWATNNTFSIFQTLVLKNPKLKSKLGIPDPPAIDAAANLKIKSPFQNIMEAIKKERAQRETAKAEIVDGSRVASPAGPPPVTFSSKPKQAPKK